MPHGHENTPMDEETKEVYLQAHIIIIIVIFVVVTIICCVWYFCCRVTDIDMIVADTDIREQQLKNSARGSKYLESNHQRQSVVPTFAKEARSEEAPISQRNLISARASTGRVNDIGGINADIEGEVKRNVGMNIKGNAGVNIQGNAGGNLGGSAKFGGQVGGGSINIQKSQGIEMHGIQKSATFQGGVSHQGGVNMNVSRGGNVGLNVQGGNASFNVQAPKMQVSYQAQRQVQAPQIQVQAPQIQVQAPQIQVQHQVQAPQVQVSRPRVNVSPPKIQNYFPEPQVQTYVQEPQIVEKSVSFQAPQVQYEAQAQVQAPQVSYQAQNYEIQQENVNVGIQQEAQYVESKPKGEYKYSVEPAKVIGYRYVYETPQIVKIPREQIKYQEVHVPAPEMTYREEIQHVQQVEVPQTEIRYHVEAPQVQVPQANIQMQVPQVQMQVPQANVNMNYGYQAQTQIQAPPVPQPWVEAGSHLTHTSQLTNMVRFPNGCKSLLCKYLTEDLFRQYQQKCDAAGVPFEQMILSGCQNVDSGVGVYAGSHDAYYSFDRLFDQIIQDYHGHGKYDNHVSDMDYTKLNCPEFTQEEKSMILSTRIRVGRNLADFPLGPGISKEQRDQVESYVVTALNKFQGELKGKYYSLGSMSERDRQQLIDDHFLFKEGDRFLQAAGLNREWPAGRGIFHNDAKTFLVWVNEEDQLRIISMEKGADIKAVFTRLSRAATLIEQEARFAHDNHLGYITSCPTNLGTALRASVHIKLPLLGKQKDMFESIADRYHVQIRGIHGEHSETDDGIFDISNKRRLGRSEVDLVQDMYNGVKAMIHAEQQLAMQGQGIVVLESDMSDEMRQFAIHVTSFAVTQYDKTQKNAMSKYVRDAFDGRYEKFWNCIVGDDFDISLWKKDGHYIKLKNKDFGFVIFKE